MANNRACWIYESADPATTDWEPFSRNAWTTSGQLSAGSSNIMLFGERDSRTEKEAGLVNPRVTQGATWTGVFSNAVTCSMAIQGRGVEEVFSPMKIAGNLNPDHGRLPSRMPKATSS